MNQVISMLEEENFVEASVYLTPPGNDEDSDTEDGCSANHLSSRQLTAHAEYAINYGADNVNSLEVMEDEVIEDGDDVETESTSSLNESETLPSSVIQTSLISI